MNVSKFSSSDYYSNKNSSNNSANYSSRSNYNSKDVGNKKNSYNNKFRSKGFVFRKKVCGICKRYSELDINYKNYNILKRFISDRGKMLPRRVTGNCTQHQRLVIAEIKKSRLLGFMSFVSSRVAK